MPYVNGRTLDRVPQPDARNASYPIRALLKREPRSYTWPLASWLDQGREGACVGFAWAHELVAAPVKVPQDDASARLIYRQAQKIDQWPGEDYEGTSVLAGAKVLHGMGLVPEYRWAFTAQDVIDTVGAYGPVVLGVNWYEQMFDTTSDGFVRVGGRVVGGHALLCLGVSLPLGYVVLHNSWGRDWGVNGRARLTFADLDRLMREDGDACVPVSRKK